MRPYYQRGSVTLYHADSLLDADALGPESVDVIHTDPPYLKQYLPLYGELARLAARLLRPHGVLLSIVPHVHLPTVMSLVGPHLTYRWLVTMLQTDGSQARYPGPGWCIRITHKPVGLWTKGSMPRVGRIGDSFVSPRGDKGSHRWQQSTAWGDYGVRWLVEGGHLVDPFCGTGTALVSALVAGVRATGYEIDEKTCEGAAKRLDEVTL